MNEMAANVVASTRTGQEHLEEKGLYTTICTLDLHKPVISDCLILVFYPNTHVADTMDFSGMSLIKLRKEEMESQVSHWMGLDGFTE